MKTDESVNRLGLARYAFRPRRVSSAQVPASQRPSSPANKPKLGKAVVSESLQKRSGDSNSYDWAVTEKTKAPCLAGYNPPGLGSNNLVHRLHQATLSTLQGRRLKQAVVSPFLQQLANFRIQCTVSPFDRRVTALEWHPRLPKTLAVASKSGDLILWNYENAAKFDLNKGVGKGGSITAMTFDLDDPSGIYTSSIDGTVIRQCLSGKQPHHTFLHSGDYNHWYCSVDANYSSNLLLAGDNFGNLILLDKKRPGEKPLWLRRLHKSKVTHCEFNRRSDGLLATASTDKTVKVWDLRMMSDRKSALYILPHERPINSACFSPDSSRLLTTDQYGELRLYAGPLWDRMERSIPHPHRFYQHLTPIKATWHPFHDLVVVGRYPDENFPGYRPSEKRSIDVFDANSGRLVCQLLDTVATGIVSLNKFSPTGDALASGMGYATLIWKDFALREQIRSEKFRNERQENGSGRQRGSPAAPFPNPSSSSSSFSANRRPRRRRRNDNDDDEDDLKTMKKKLSKRKTKR